MNNNIIDVLSNICDDKMTISTVVGGAPFHGTDFLRKAIGALSGKSNFEKLIGVDGGAKVLLDLGYEPDLFVGDCDSFGGAKESMYLANAQKESVLVYPSEKDDTDMQLAVETAVRHGAEKVVLLCATNGRLDHFLGCFQLLEYFGESAEMPAELIIADEQNVMFYVGQDKKDIDVEISDEFYFSIIPVSDRVEGLNIRDAKYLLDDFELVRGASRCISNCLPDGEVQGTVKIEKKSGAFVVVISKDV